jgi:hypothetical protein
MSQKISIEEVKHFLKNTDQSFYSISKSTGVNPVTLKFIMNGKTKEMQKATADKLDLFLNGDDGKKKKEELKKAMCELIDQSL